MNSNIDNRQMPIFISSTFQDMQGERDCLMKHVFPKLKELAARRSVTLTPIDLRWGVTQEESKSGKVVELCLHEIDRCRPFFIGILGERYGWSPQFEDISANSMLLDQYQWLKEDIDNGLSLTEIEMQYAVLRQQNHGYAFFFIKFPQQESTSEDDRVKKLADSIRSKGVDLCELTNDDMRINADQRCFYSYYKTPEDLAMKVEDAFVKLFQILFPKVDNQDEWSRERTAQQAYLHELTNIYVPTVNNERISYYLDRMTSKYEMISSNEDCYYGKSAFMANWIKERQEKDSCDIVYHFIGVGYLGGNYKRILKRLCLEVSALYGAEAKEGDDAKYDRDYGRILSQLLQNTEIRKPLFIILDGLQHLSDDDSKMLNWFPVLPDNAFMIVTAPRHDMSYEAYRRRYDAAFLLDPFEEEEELLFIDRYLQKFGKRLSPAQLDRIISAYRSAGLPPTGGKDILTLKLLLNELVVFGSYELLGRRIAYYCENNLSHFFPRMLERWEKDFGSDTVRLVLSLIVHSRAGLTETEILDITKATPSQWSGLYYTILHLLTLKGGKYYIDKDLVAKEITKRYVSWERDTRQSIIEYFRNSQDNRAVEECLFQYYKLQDYDSLYDIIIRLDVFSHLFDSSGVAELLPYWKALHSFYGRRRFRIAAYARQEIPIEEKYARILADIAQFAIQVLGDTESARLLLLKSKEILDSVVHCDYHTMAQVYSGLGDYDNALDCIDKELALRGIFDTYLGDDMTRLNLISEKGSILFKLGKIRQASELWKQTLDKVILIVGEVSLPVSSIYRNLAAAYQVLGHDDLCKEFIERTMVILKKTVGEEHAFMGDALFLYGTYHEGVGHLVEAHDYYQKALDIYQRCHPENHWQVLQTKDAVDRMECSMPEDEFLRIVDFYEGIVDDLYLVGEGREDGIPEYEYKFRYKHDCYIEKDRYVYGPSNHHIYICVDSSGKYVSCGKAFDNLRDAQVDYLVSLCTFYKEYCTYKNIE